MARKRNRRTIKMGMFKKKQETDRENVEIKSKEPETKEEITLEQVIAGNTEAWYKGQVWNILVTIKEELQEINKTLKEIK
jgi:hypothetical protein